MTNQYSKTLRGAVAALITIAAMATVAMFYGAPAHATEDNLGAFDPAAPAAFQFGAGLDAHAATFESACTSFETRDLPLEQNPMATESHTQVDCQGFAYYGAPRLAEFVFANDALTHVWVLTDEEDLPGMTAAFEARFGTPSHDLGDNGKAWISARAGVRYDVPEALYMSEAAAPFFAAWFDSMASGEGPN